MPIQLELLMVDSNARRSFTNSVERCHPRILDLKSQISQLTIPGEALEQVVGTFIDHPLAWVTALDDNLPKTFYFNAGYGEARDFRKSADHDFLALVGFQFAGAIRRSTLSKPTQDAICATIHEWTKSLPDYFPDPSDHLIPK